MMGKVMRRIIKIATTGWQPQRKQFLLTVCLYSSAFSLGASRKLIGIIVAR